MKKLLVTLLLVCMLLPTVAHAGPPQDVEGYFVYTPNEDCTIRWAGDNEFWRDCTDWGEYYAGDFLGDSEEVYDVILHGSQGNYVFESGWYKGIVTLTGTVLGRSGTVEILFIGFSEGDIFAWTGTWRIVGGTGDLAGVHGQGDWGSSEDPEYPGVHYWGKVHFEP
jgi:hypothetical protein